MTALYSSSTPDGRESSTTTAKFALPVSPPASVPMVSTQTEPALPSGVHVQPELLFAASNVVLTGTVSMISTPVLLWLPLLANSMTLTTVSPGVAVTPPSLLAMDRSDQASTSTASSSSLLSGVGSRPLLPSTAMTASLYILSTPEASGSSTTSAKLTLPESPPASEPRSIMQVEPALSSGEQVQPGLLATESNVV